MDLELHVNISGRQLEDADLVDEVRRTLGRTGFPAHLLVLEITESVAVDIADKHIERLLALQSLGVRLAIDDFGTGYSSLSYLRTLPVDVLKIDRAFAKTLGGTTDQVLLEAIVKLGHSLGIEVIAEGIEREEQADALRRMGCRLAQGYLFFRPVDPSRVPTLLVASPRWPLPSTWRDDVDADGQDGSDSTQGGEAASEVTGPDTSRSEPARSEPSRSDPARSQPSRSQSVPRH